MEKAKSFLIEAVNYLVDKPQDVRVEVKKDDMGVLLTLSVAPGDVGKVIGKEGNTAKALRSLLRAIGMREKARINLKIAEPEGGRNYGSSNERVANEPYRQTF